MYPIRQVLFFFLFISSVFTAAAQNEQQLLSEAIYEEEINGDLETAIGIYNQIVQGFPANRSVLAEALWHLGLCHEKLGLKKATQYYQQLASNYKDQPKFSNSARRRLQELTLIIEEKATPNLPDPLAEQALSQLKTSKVFSSPGFYGTISPSGQYFSFSNWENGNLVMYNRYTQESKELKTDASWGSARWVDRSIWSPDSKKIAYCWIQNHDDTQIRIYDTEDESIRLLSTLQENAMLWPIEWTKDGSAILATLFDKTLRRLRYVLVSVSDGAISQIKLVPKGESCGNCGLTISDDGQYVIYDKKLKNGKTDLHILSIDGNIDQPLLESPATLRIAKWLEYKNGFLYYSNISGYNALWKASIDESFHIQNTELLLDGLTAEYNTIGLSDNDTYYYLQSSNIGNISIIDFDPDSGTLNQERTLTSSNPHPRHSPFWSPDGSKLAYFRTRPLEPNENYLEIRDMASGKENILVFDSLSLAGPPGEELESQWSPDGLQLLINQWQAESERFEIYLADTQTGGHKKVVAGLFPKAFGKNDNIYYVKGDSLVFTIKEYGLTSGDSAVLYSTATSNINHLTISPDGKFLAFIESPIEQADRQNELMMVSLDNGMATSLWKSEAGTYFTEKTGLNWLHDNKHLLIAVSDDKYTYQQLYLYDTETGSRQTLGAPIQGKRNFMRSIRMHPTKNSFVFGIWHGIKSVWALENF